MNELLEKYLQNGLADFEGLQITGHIPVKQELINALIADALKPDPLPDTPPTPSSPAAEDVPSSLEAAAAAIAAPPKKKRVDQKALINLVKSMVKRAEVTAADGALVLDFELRR